MQLALVLLKLRAFLPDGSVSFKKLSLKEIARDIRGGKRKQVYVSKVIYE
jgi:hypothetical protein